MTEAVANKSTSAQSVCWWNPLSGFSYFCSCITNIFKSSEVSGYTVKQFEALGKERDIKILQKYNETDPKKLGTTITKAAMTMLEWTQKRRVEDMNATSQYIFETYNNDQFVDLISSTAATTIVEILCQDNPKPEDLRLLEAIFKPLISDFTQPMPEETEQERWARWFGSVFQPGETHTERLWRWVDVVNVAFRGQNWENKHIQSLPDHLQQVIKKFANNNGSIEDHVAAGVLHFNIPHLKAVVQENNAALKVLLSDILSALFNKKIHSHLEDPAKKKKITEFLTRVQLEAPTDGKFKDLVTLVLSRAVNHISGHFVRWFAGNYSLLDKGMESFESHLKALSSAKRKAGEDDFTTLRLDELKQKRGSLTEENDKLLAESIWGPNYAIMDDKEAKDRLSLHKMRYYESYLAFRFYTKEEGVHEALKCPSPEASHEQMKVLSTEFSVYLFDILDSFLSDAFLTELINDVSKHEYVHVLIPGDEDRQQIKELFPFLKLVLSATLRNYIRGTTASNGLYNLIEGALSKESMEKMVNSLLLPSIKETLYVNLIHTIIASDISLLDKSKVDAIATAFIEAYPGGEAELNKTYLKEIINGVMNKYFGYEEEGKHINGFIDEIDPQYAPGDDPVKQKQFFDLFSGSSPYKGEPVSSYAEVVKMLLVDFGGLSTIFKWFLSLFDSIISTRITAFLYPYRRTPNYFARIFENKIEHYMGTVDKVEKLFKKEEPPTAPDTTPTITSVEEISKLIYAQSTYKSSDISKWFTTLFLGAGGSKITSISNNILKNTLYNGSVLNQALLFNVVKVLRDRVHDSATEVDVTSSDPKDAGATRKTKEDLCRE